MLNIVYSQMCDNCSDCYHSKPMVNYCRYPVDLLSRKNQKKMSASDKRSNSTKVCPYVASKFSYTRCGEWITNFAKFKATTALP